MTEKSRLEVASTEVCVWQWGGGGSQDVCSCRCEQSGLVQLLTSVSSVFAQCPMNSDTITDRVIFLVLLLSLDNEFLRTHLTHIFISIIFKMFENRQHSMHIC